MICCGMWFSLKILKFTLKWFPHKNPAMKAIVEITRNRITADDTAPASISEHVRVDSLTFSANINNIIQAVSVQCACKLLCLNTP